MEDIMTSPRYRSGRVRLALLVALAAAAALVGAQQASAHLIACNAHPNAPFKSTASGGAVTVAAASAKFTCNPNAPDISQSTVCLERISGGLWFTVVCKDSLIESTSWTLSTAQGCGSSSIRQYRTHAYLSFFHGSWSSTSPVSGTVSLRC
jgi:hypothetical protein